MSLTGQNLCNSFLVLNLPRGNSTENIFRVCSCRHRGIPLPLLVLVAIRVVTYTPDDQTRKMVHQPSGLHFKAQNVFFAASRSRTVASLINRLADAINP